MNDRTKEMFDTVYNILTETGKVDWPEELSNTQCISLIEKMIEHFEQIDEFDKCSNLQNLLEKMK